MDRNPKAYQVLAVGSCPKEIKTKLCINEPLMKNDYLTFRVREISMGLHPSHHITSILWETKSFSQSSSEEKPSEAVWLLRKWERKEKRRKSKLYISKLMYRGSISPIHLYSNPPLLEVLCTSIYSKITR